MTLHVQSARISYRGPDRLDVTRKSGTDGLFLAPSWAILRPALDAMNAAKEEWDFYANEGAWSCGEDARRRLDGTWRSYITAYEREMAKSRVENRAQWDALLARDRVVLCCYCTDPEHCHRALLRARILPALGAIDEGEVRNCARSTQR